MCLLFQFNSLFLVPVRTGEFSIRYDSCLIPNKILNEIKKIGSLESSGLNTLMDAFSDYLESHSNRRKQRSLRIYQNPQNGIELIVRCEIHRKTVFRFLKRFKHLG